MQTLIKNGILYTMTEDKGIFQGDILVEGTKIKEVAEHISEDCLEDGDKLIEAEGYYVSYHVVYCPDYGIPQTRKRLVLLASKLGEIELISPTHQKDNYVTVGDVISNLPPLQAGEECPTDKLHRSRALSALNMRRIDHTLYRYR